MNKIGLVLSGGGAKGAYEVGVIKYLAERNFRIDAISGASIGSLNGAVIASSENLNIATEKLLNIWTSVWQNQPIGFDKLDIKDKSIINTILLLINYFGYSTLFNNFLILKNIIDLNDDNGFFSNNTERQYIKNNIDFNKLISGIPFYVSVYESEGKLIDILKYISKTNKPSNYLKIQDYNDEKDIINILLASSSIPYIFKAINLQGKKYYDGGLGDSYKIWGNTPIIPLIDNEKCDTIIVIHLSDGSLWDRNAFKTTNIVEIRPQSTIKRNGFLDIVSFNENEINSWIKQGYNDAKIIIEKITKQFVNTNKISSEFIKLNSKLNELQNDNFNIK